MLASIRRHHLVPPLLCIGALAALIVSFNALVAYVVCAIAGTLIAYRPALIPFAAYAFMVPFDNLLQTGTGTVTKFLAVVAFGVLLLTFVDRRFRIGPPRALFVWSLYLLWNIASLLWSRDPYFSQMDQLATTLELFVLYAAFSGLRISARGVRLLLAATVAGAVCCAGYGIALYVSGQAISRASASDRLAIQVGNAFINADHFSAALVMPIALAMVAAVHWRGPKQVAAAAALAVLFGGVFVSGTRGSLIAIGVVWLSLMIASRHRLALLLMGIVGLAVSIPFPNVWARFMDPSQGDAGGRYGIWGIAWTAFQQHWLLGIGTEQFRLAYAEAYLSSPSPIVQHPWMEDAHNLIASSAVELGIIGLVLVLVAWFTQWRVASRIGPASPLFGPRIALEAGTLGLFVNAMSADMMFYKYLWLAFTLAVLVRNAQLATE